MFPDLSESDARQAIESLMDEEASIAEDPTQNAMLSPSQSVRLPDEMEEPDVEALQDVQSEQAGVGEPEDVPVPEHPADEAVELDDYDPNTAVAQSDDVPLPAQDAQPAPESDQPPEDESDAIRAPEAATELSEMSDEEYVEAVEPLSIAESPPQEWGQRSDPDWDDAIQDMILQSMEYHADKTDSLPPDVDDDEVGWQQALSDRSNSL